MLGPVALGEAQETVRARLPRFDLYSYHTDNFCLSALDGVRPGARVAAVRQAIEPIRWRRSTERT